MKKSNTSWSPLYVAIALFGAWGGWMLAIKGPPSVPTSFLIFAGSVSMAFAAWTVFAGLWRHFRDSNDRSVLSVSIWDSSPLNPQSNRLAQVIFFGTIGVTSLLRARSPISQSLGFIPLAMAVGIVGGLLAFRWKYRRRITREGSAEKA